VENPEAMEKGEGDSTKKGRLLRQPPEPFRSSWRQSRIELRQEEKTAF